jgi:nicotinamide mononucleotide transporter
MKDRAMPFSEILPAAILDMKWLEFAGLVSGLVCVWLLIRENVWTFPIGLVYAFVSVAVFVQQRLYADVLLSAYYVLMNGYGWWYWLYGGSRNVGDDLPPQNISRAALVSLSGLSVIGIAAMGWFFASQTDADLPYWDSATTVLSFVAMWMTARKFVENWIVWLIVDVLATAVYAYKGIDFYALLYAIYFGMAIMGWRAWRRSMASTESAA